jgi:hypothetical protein
LNLVPADAFDDHRNADPYLPFWPRADYRVPETYVTERDLTWFTPRISLSCFDGRLPNAPTVYGYAPDDELDRAYWLEVWIEKSTMDDILKPLCRELGITLVTSIGYQSITSTVKLLNNRVNVRRKPTRIFYISDYDKAGSGMPPAVARQIEFWLPVYAPDADVKLEHIALTEEQVDRYKLPPDFSKRRPAVELDALEARHPGELGKLVREAVEPYLDRTIRKQLTEAQQQAEEIVDEQWDEIMEPHERKLATINNNIRRIVKRYEKEVAALNKRLQRDMARFKGPIDRLRAAVTEDVDAFDPDLPERPAQAVIDIEGEDEWLFDSSREYLEQLEFYKAHQGKPTVLSDYETTKKLLAKIRQADEE